MPITLICYHYVRDLERSRYPAIKGLTTASFRGQIDYVKKHYQVLGGQDLLDAAASGAWGDLPANSAVLTFDDGYLDHYTTVFPILMDAGLRGCFFPPALAVEDRRLLDVNKIHFILAAAPDPGALLESLFTRLEACDPACGLLTRQEYLQKLWSPGRYDPPEIAVFKRLLQRELPLELRGAITDALFQEFVEVDQATFASELYLTMDQARLMSAAGMYFGSHGSRHVWLNALPLPEAELDIAHSLQFLARLGVSTQRWIMCYPYGGFSEALFPVLQQHGCALALTTRTGEASPSTDHPFAWPRLDTNELPFEAHATFKNF